MLATSEWLKENTPTDFTQGDRGQRNQLVIHALMILLLTLS